MFDVIFPERRAHFNPKRRGTGIIGFNAATASRIRVN
jgi:hypothetical protein